MVYRCTIEKEGDEYIAQFPGMPNVVTCGFTHKEALDGCLESDISRGMPVPPPSFDGGHPVSVATHSLRLRDLRGNRSQTEIANRDVPGIPAPRKPAQVQPDG